MVNAIKKISWETWVTIFVPLLASIVTWLVMTSANIRVNGSDIEDLQDETQQNTEKIEDVDQKREDDKTDILKEMRRGFDRIEDKLDDLQKQ